MKGIVYCFLLMGLMFVAKLTSAQAPQPSIRFHITYADSKDQESVRMILHHESDTSGMPKEMEKNSATENYFDTSQVCRSSDFCKFQSLLKKYHQIIFVGDERSNISQDIEPDSYHSVFDVHVNGPKIDVTNTTPWFLRSSKPYSIYRTIILSIVFEVLVLWLVLLIVGYPNKLRFMLGVFLANILGLTLFFGLMEISDSSYMWFTAEAGMIAVETLFVWYFMKKAASLKKMGMLVLFLNVFSVFAGGAMIFFSMLFGQEIIQMMH